MVNARLHKSPFYCQSPTQKIHLLLEDFFLFSPFRFDVDFVAKAPKKVHFFMCLNFEVKMVVNEKVLVFLKVFRINNKSWKESHLYA